jgi:hypothetical protein
MAGLVRGRAVAVEGDNQQPAQYNSIILNKPPVVNSEYGQAGRSLYGKIGWGCLPESALEDPTPGASLFLLTKYLNLWYTLQREQA